MERVNKRTIRITRILFILMLNIGKVLFTLLVDMDKPKLARHTRGRCKLMRYLWGRIQRSLIFIREHATRVNANIAESQLRMNIIGVFR